MSRKVETMVRITDQQLKVLVSCFEDIIPRCLETLDISEHDDLRWFKSYQRMEPSDRPFKRPQNERTLRQYIATWKSSIVYLFRVGALDKNEREKHFGIRFHETQEKAMRKVLHLLRGYQSSSIKAGNDKDSDDSDDADPEDEEGSTTFREPPWTRYDGCR
jgi:hypothetical protein